MTEATASQPRIKITWLIGIFAAFAIFVVIGAYSARMTQTFSDYDQQRAQQRYATLAQVRHDEQVLISPVDAQGNPTAEWIDQDKGIIRIPIEQAMATEIDTLKAEAPQVGCVIPGTVPPAPAPAPTAGAPTTGATNAAPAAATAPAAAKPKSTTP
jgi:hypothetical protein